MPAFGWLIFYGQNVFHRINCQNLCYKFWLLCINPIFTLMIQGLYILVGLGICATDSIILQIVPLRNFLEQNWFIN